MKRLNQLLKLITITVLVITSLFAYMTAEQFVHAFNGGKDDVFYTLKKVDENGNPVFGATFSIESNLVWNGKPTDTYYFITPDGSTSDVPITEWTTTPENNAEIILNTLAPDKVRIVITETFTPPGYESAEPIEIIARLNGSTGDWEGTINGVDERPGTDTTITVVNKKKKYPVTISKKDGVGAFLEGAVLEITGTDFTGDAIDKITIESGSSASVAQLPAGKYKLHEKTAPKGYELAEDIEFEVTTDGTIKIGNDTVDEVVMTDEKQTTPKLSVKKTSSVTKAKPGDVIPYVITIKNSGDGDAEDVVVLDTMGNNLSYVSDDSNGVHDGQKVSWNVALAAGETKTINIKCRINEDAAGKIINNVEITNVKGEYIEESGAEDAYAVVLDEYETEAAETGDKSHAFIFTTFALSLLLTLGMAVYKRQ